MNEIPWSLHLLSEVLAAFSVEDPYALRNVINRVAEAVDAEVVAILRQGSISHCIGLSAAEQPQLTTHASEHPSSLELASGHLHTYWAPMGEGALLVIGRLTEAFNLEERSLLRAMGRSIQLSAQVLQALTAEREAKDAALRQATHDAMTGLPSRALVLERLGAMLAAQANPERVATVLFVDIDRFKQINDVHGHASGDQFLIAVAEVLRSVVRSDDLVGRLSGDEFVVITLTASPRDAESLAARIIERVSRPLLLAGKLVSHSPSIGIAFAIAEDSAESLIENADMAMYRAKDRGRGCYATYDRSMRLDAQHRAAIETDLRRGVHQGEIRPYLQPIVTLPDRRLIGFEALARWQHPRHGLLAPSEFINVAEDTGLIVEIDTLILKEACAVVGSWRHAHPELPLRLSVNISGRTFVDPSLPDHVAAALLSSGLEADNLYLEITETMLVEDIESTTQVVERLKQLGVRLAIDDFGTGYSSLLYLKRLPVGILKIDRSFIDGLGVDREDEVIVKAVIGVARALDIDLVAEGVETERQLEMLVDLGCDYVQGYLFGRPCDVDTARSLLHPQERLASPSQVSP
ncbi:MAG: bifunctional diguanylate cyclase/phosphodiesterase [Synechococcaceae cyanobacterium ELA739]